MNADGPAPGDRGQDVRWNQSFTADDLAALRQALRHHAGRAGLNDDALDDLCMAAHELITNALRHGGGYGEVELRRDADTIVCQVIDQGPGFTASPDDLQRPPAHVAGGRGLWLARQLTHHLTLEHRSNGVTASVAMHLTNSHSAPAASATCPPHCTRREPRRDI
ncbi:ATP-binding protein [Actinoplanes sp. NPDC051859]|uniref:ATP-binding protein n=1 Tax=Actinoplanes sp. NPDC051859 TaxID=3363909 RepID=UPI0037ABC9E8